MVLLAADGIGIAIYFISKNGDDLVASKTAASTREDGPGTKPQPSVTKKRDDPVGSDATSRTQKGNPGITPPSDVSVVGIK